MGAKNNDSLSEKQAIVIFYTLEYRKCGKFNSKNDSRLWVGASAISKSVDFRAFAVNVKTIASKKYLYQSGHAIWCGTTPNVVLTLLDSLNLNGKHAAVFTTSGATKPIKLAASLKKSYPAVKWHKPLNANGMTEEEIRDWM